MRQTIVLIILACWAMVLVSQPPSPTKAKPRQEKQSVASGKQQSGHSENEPATSPSIHGGQIIYANPEHATGDEQQKSSTDWWLTLFTGVLAVVAVFQLVAAGFQYCAMRAQGKIAKAAMDTQKAMSRAWIAISFIDRPGSRQKIKNGHVRSGYGFNWTVANTGNSPAFIYRIGARFQKISSFDELPAIPDIETGVWAMPTSRYVHGLSVPPGGTIERYTFASRDDKQPIEVSEYDEIQEGKVIWLAYGVIEYRTAFDGAEERRETRFCYRWTPGSDEIFSQSDMPSSYTLQT